MHHHIHTMIAPWSTVKMIQRADFANQQPQALNSNTRKSQYLLFDYTILNIISFASSSVTTTPSLMPVDWHVNKCETTLLHEVSKWSIGIFRLSVETAYDALSRRFLERFDSGGNEALMNFRKISFELFYRFTCLWKKKRLINRGRWLQPDDRLDYWTSYSTRIFNSLQSPVRKAIVMRVPQCTVYGVIFNRGAIHMFLRCLTNEAIETLGRID